MFLKRHRADLNERRFGGHDLNVVVQEQAQEIASLKHDKNSLESCVNELRAENEKVVNENKILKRAVTIQQDRQNQAASEVEAARNYKAEADDRMKKLEHMIMTLRYHLQAQHSNPENDFMDFTQRPPDVF
jgi:chromosome segregation ATPase